MLNTYPRFCGKEIISPQAVSVNEGNTKVAFVYREKNGTQQDYFAFYYSVREFTLGGDFFSLEAINLQIKLIHFCYVANHH